MKATLKFNLPEEVQEFDMAVNAPGLTSVIMKIDNYIKNIKKYEPVSEESLSILEKIHSQLWTLIEEYNVQNIF